MKEKLQTVNDNNGNKVVVLPDIIFKNKQNIDWDAVGNYAKRYVGSKIIIEKSKDTVNIGTIFPSEYKGSKYTKRLKGANAKAKANAVQGICEMLEIATEKCFMENKKEKHSGMAEKGWYYYTARFAVPIYNNEVKAGEYNIYSGCFVVNHAENGKLYVYDLINIKREASTPITIR